MTQGKNREIRRVMQKNSFRVNRLKRLSYGPYSLFDLNPGEIRETEILPEIKNLMYLAQRNKIKEREEKKTRLEQIKIESVEGVKKSRKRIEEREKKLNQRKNQNLKIESSGVEKNSNRLPEDVKDFKAGFNLRK